MKKQKSLVVPYIFLAGLSVVFLMPIYWMIATSLKTQSDLFAYPPVFFPKTLEWSNYLGVFETINFFQLTGNSLLISVMVVIGTLFSAPLTAYACSHIHWRGQKILFVIVMATLLLPYQVTMLPIYIIWNKMGMVGSNVPLILPAFLSVGVGYFIFLFRQFFLSLPHSLVQAARIDGASEVRIYVQIILPLCKPVLATVGVLVFLQTWSDFLGPLLYLNDESNYTISLGLYSFMQSNYVEWEKLMAASAMFTVPIVVVFFFAQKQFIEGISLTGIKG
jgi:multiple sugar transport system permease protein